MITEIATKEEFGRVMAEFNYVSKTIQVKLGNGTNYTIKKFIWL